MGTGKKREEIGMETGKKRKEIGMGTGKKRKEIGMGTARKREEIGMGTGKKRKEIGMGTGRKRKEIVMGTGTKWIGNGTEIAIGRGVIGIVIGKGIAKEVIGRGMGWTRVGRRRALAAGAVIARGRREVGRETGSGATALLPGVGTLRCAGLALERRMVVSWPCLLRWTPLTVAVGLIDANSKWQVFLTAELFWGINKNKKIHI